jgi:hypothetical protein
MRLEVAGYFLSSGKAGYFNICSDLFDFWQKKRARMGSFFASAKLTLRWLRSGIRQHKRRNRCNHLH